MISALSALAKVVYIIAYAAQIVLMLLSALAQAAAKPRKSARLYQIR